MSPETSDPQSDWVPLVIFICALGLLLFFVFGLPRLMVGLSDWRTRSKERASPKGCASWYKGPRSLIGRCWIFVPNAETLPFVVEVIAVTRKTATIVSWYLDVPRYWVIPKDLFFGELSPLSYLTTREELKVYYPSVYLRGPQRGIITGIEGTRVILRNANGGFVASRSIRTIINSYRPISREAYVGLESAEAPEPIEIDQGRIDRRSAGRLEVEESDADAQRSRYEREIAE